MYPNTLIDILKDKSNLKDTGVCFIEGGEKEDFLSYQDLYETAIKVLGFLKASGLKPKDELVFQIEDNKTFILVFWACILGGIIPVPVAIGRNDDHKLKVFNIWPVLNNPWLIVSQKHLEMLKGFAHTKGLESTFADLVKSSLDLDNIYSKNAETELYAPHEDEIAFIQFSSGSTGSPKGVTLTHRNLITNMDAIAKGGKYSTQDSLISWMPLTHDMGLIGFHLNPLFCGIQQYIIPTGLFVRRPSIWLDKASEHKITVLCSPNFGYHYVIKHCLGSTKPDWDLAHVRLIYNGAEPISEELCQEFLTKMQDFGLDSSSMCPVYGLAEATLAVSMSKLENPVSSIHLNREHLNFGNKVLEEKTSRHTVSFVNVGSEVPHCSIRITDRNRNKLEDNFIGQVEIKGNNVTARYYNNESATKAVITEDAWLNTGDLGFLRNGELYITGRDKDIIFINGQNYYPHDIERLGEEVPGIELNKLAIAGYFNHANRKDELLGFIFHRGDLQKFIPISEALQKHINQQIGINLDRVIPVKVIPKTTSGKIQRFKLLKDFQAGAFTEIENKLKQLYNKKTDTAQSIQSPSSQEEEKILNLWKKVLQRKTISVTDKFFEIGGNSLRAAEFGMYLQKEFQVELSLDKLYQNQTIKEIARELQNLNKATFLPILKSPQQKWHPVSSAQRNIFYQWELNKSSLSYNMPLAIQVNGIIEEEKLAKAFNQIVQRHDSLRMNFRLLNEPQFTINPKVDAQVKLMECSLHSVSEFLSALVKPFDLAQDPLFRSNLIKLKHEKHILFLDIHHIVSDGISVHKLVKELWTLYKGIELPDTRLGFKDYVAWEQELLTSQQLASQKNYWHAQLSEELPVLDLTLDFPRPTLFNDKGGKLAFHLDEYRTLQLKNFADAHNCSLHVLMFTFYNLLLSKYSGQEEMIIGIPVGVRPHADLQDMHGMFVNNLPIKTSIHSTTSFLQVLQAINTTVKEALQHKNYPFELMLKELTKARDVSRNPVFDTMFVFQNMGLPQPLESNVFSFRYFFDPGFSKYDLSMEIFDESDSLEYAIEYASSLFKQETIASMGKHFESLIADVLEDPKKRISEVSLLSEKEYQRFVEEFNHTEAPIPSKRIHQLFEAQAAKTPENIALEFEGNTYTYKQLNEKANRQAQVLKQNGLQAGSGIAILLDRSPELIISILAAFKAGAYYVPIDVELPTERIHFIVQDCRADLIVTEKKYQHLVSHNSEDFAELDISLVYVKTHVKEGKEPVLNQKESEIDPLAYIIYTSGTTGKPKGVMISQQSLVNYICWAAQVYGKGERANFPLFSSISFDLTITSIFTPLITGSSLIIYGQQKQELLINQVISDNKVDVIKLTPSHLKLLCQQEILPVKGESCVKRLIVGGEQLTTQLAQNTYQLFEKKIEILNEYGPTEATVGCMIQSFEEDDISAAVPIGVPAQNTQLYVLDSELQPVAVGIEGELYISGKGLAKGYINRPDLTKQTFLANPFKEGSRMYKTGDRVRRLPTGVLLYIGRRDNQVKINGYRIELAEIEHHIRNHDLIQDAVACISKNESGKTYLNTYYQPISTTDAQLGEVGLKDFLADKLPHYMIPVNIYSVDNFPLTQNGKIDHLALEKLGEEAGKEENRLPTSFVEKLSIRIWEEVLGEKDIKVNDNFFALGGDSIKAVQIASRLHEQGIALQVKDILTYHTIEQISRHTHEINGTQTYNQGIIEGDIEAWPIISWFFKQKFKKPGFYNQSILLRLNKNLQVEKLEEAFQALIKHHDGLRINHDVGKNTLFFNPAHLSSSFKVKHHKKDDLQDLNEIIQEISSGFNLSDELLIEAAVIEERGEMDYLFIKAHHLVIDGISWRILLEDLYTFYQTLSEHEPVKFPRKTASLKAWSNRLSEAVRKNLYRKERTYWEEIANTPFAVPVDMETEDWKAENLRTVQRKLDVDSTTFLLKKAPQIHKIDILQVQLLALARTLKTWTQGKTAIIELENHGRHVEGIDISRTIGWFTVMHPLKLVLETESFDEQIKAVKQQTHEIPNKGIGYGILKHLTHQIHGSQSERTEVRFNYLGQFEQELENELFSFEEHTGATNAKENILTAKLEFNTMVINGHLQVEVNYNRKAHKESTIQEILSHFFAQLNEAIEHIKYQATSYLVPSDFEDVDLEQEELDALFN